MPGALEAMRRADATALGRWAVESQQGAETALRMKRAVARVQTRILEPLNTSEREQFVRLLGKLVAGPENRD